MKGILFDFNGTLFWDSQLHYDAWEEYSAILRGYPFTYEEMRDRMFGHTNEDIIEYAIGKKPTKEMVEKYGKEKEAVYRKRAKADKEHFKLAPGAIELLDYLKENNIPRNIATMSEWDNVEFYIEEFHLGKWFDIDKIAYSDGTLPGKPSPDIYLLAARNFGVALSDCVVVEDAISGIQSAQNAGVGKVVAIASLEPLEFYQNMKGLDAIIKDFYEFDRTIFNKTGRLC